VAGTLDGAAANVAGNAVAVGFLAGKPVDAVVSSDMRAECVVHTGTALLVAGTALMLAAGTVLLVAAGTALLVAGTALLAAGNALLLAAGNALLLVAGTARAADGVLLLVAAAAVGTSLLLAAAAVAALLAASDSSGTAWLPAGAGGKAAAAGRCALGYFLPQQIPLRQSQTSVSDETIFYCRWK
jgi:hypothetical protein